MCIGVPVRVVDGDDVAAWCDGRGGRQRVDMMLVGAQPAGTWLLAFRGSAVRVLSDEEASATNAALDALDAALAGESDFAAYFGDLIGREPQLPAHLKGSAS
jgi:hydrogenase expression/formation protein HypC